MYSKTKIGDFNELVTVWAWYFDKLGQGKIEDILADEMRYLSLKEFLNKEFKDKDIGKLGGKYKLLFLTISKDHIGEIDHVKNFLLNRFEIKSSNIISLNAEGDPTNDCDELRYIIPILDLHFDMLEDYYFEINSKINSGNQSMVDCNSHYSCKSTHRTKQNGKFLTTPTIRTVISQSSLMKLNQIIPDSNEEDAIVLNFTRSKRCQKCRYDNNKSCLKSCNTLTILNSNLGKTACSSRSNFIGSASETASIASYPSLCDTESDVYYEETNSNYEPFPVLNRLTVNNSNNWDIQIGVNILAGVDANGDIWQAVKKTRNDDWVVYDSNFALRNLGYCTLDDILISNTKEILMLFCKII